MTGDGGGAGLPGSGLLTRLMGNLLLAVGALLFLFVLVPFVVLLLVWSVVALTFRMVHSAITGRGWVGGVRRVEFGRGGAGGGAGAGGVVGDGDIPSADGAGRENVRVRR